MTVTLNRGGPTKRPAPVAGHAFTRWGLLTDLEHPGQVFANITPNWYASIMGTGIVAVAAASLPEQFPGLHVAATVIWALAVALLIAVTAATTLHWLRHRETARGHLNDPVMAHFYGAPPMAIVTVGAGALLLGRHVIGLRAAIDADWVLWSTGTSLGLIVAVAVPYLTFTRPVVRPDSPVEAGPVEAGPVEAGPVEAGPVEAGPVEAGPVEAAAFGGWLMPIVAPMVSASTGALLVPYAPAGQPRLTLLLSCYAMFGISLLASLVVITLIWGRLAVHKVGPARMVPTLWIVLGPLGQSITAANLLGGVAHDALPAPYATGLEVAGVVYGLPVWGFALLWAAIASAITASTAREGLPFSLTWWSFTFPVGTCVTGTTALAAHTGSDMFRVAAAVLFGALVAAWLIVAARTVRGSARGWLFLPAGAASSHVSRDRVQHA
jgi:tellurite resistance protein TehA-like permease